MATTYSTYEAKAKFSEILRKVREGQRIVISYHGHEVAEIRPLERRASPEEALRRLEEDGILSKEPRPEVAWAPLAKRPGALRRFLESRE